MLSDEQERAEECDAQKLEDRAEWCAQQIGSIHGG